MCKIAVFLSTNLHRIFLIVFFILFTYSNGKGQDVFHKIIGTSRDDSGSLFKIEDEYYLVGYTTINGSEDMYIVHLSENLDVLWSKIYGTSVGDRAMEIVQKSNGNLLISGWGNSGSSTALLEIEPSGDIVNTMGFGSFHDRLPKILKTKDGGYLNYGELEGSIPGHNKVALIKYDSELNIQWKNYYDQSSSSDNSSWFEIYGRQAVELKDNGFAILGSYTKINNATNNRKIRVIRIDENGNEMWTRGFQGGRMDNAHHIIQCDDGGFLISATSNSFSNHTEILIIKTDSNGTKEWTKTFGGDNDDLAGQLLQLANGNFMITGTTESFGAKGKDFLLFEIDENGNLLKAHMYGGEKDDILIKIDKESDFFMLSGSSNSFEQPDNNIYIVKTRFKEASSDCSSDVTSLVNSNEVYVSFFDEHYSQGVFIAPVAKSLNRSDVSSYVIEPCSDCPTDNNESYILCPGESKLINYTEKTTNSINWEDGSAEFVREIFEEGIYWVEYQIGLCVIRDSLIIYKESDVELGEDKTICPDDQLVLDATLPNGISYRWQDNSTNPLYTVSKPGIYIINIQTQNCVLQDSIEIWNQINYTLDLGENKTICYDETIIIDASLPSALSYKWQDGNISASYEASKAGWYWVEVTTNCNTISDSLEVRHPQRQDIFIPNVITPNGDTFNDNFEILGTDSPVGLTIFNRWGKEVYDTNLYNNKWNGGNLSSGIYYYLVQIGCINQEHKGWLQILKD